MKREKGVMGKELFRRIVDESSRWKHQIEIVPTMYGEFFLNPEWKYYLKYISDHVPRCRISIPTNGSCVDDDVIDFLVKIPNLKYISFSVYVYSQEAYRELIGLPADTILKVSHTIKRLQSERPDIELRVGTTSDSEFMSNTDEIKMLKTVFKNMVDVHEITRNREYRGYNNSRVETTSCGTPFLTMVVLHDGAVVPCCYDPEAEIVLGNANLNTLFEIWNGKLSKEFRFKHRNGARSSIPLCRSCSLTSSSVATFALRWEKIQ